MIPTASDLRRRRDRHVWTEAAWDAEEASLPLGKNWRWLRSDGSEAFLVKGEGVIERFCPGEGGDLTHTGTMHLPSGPGSNLRFKFGKIAYITCSYPPKSAPKDFAQTAPSASCATRPPWNSPTGTSSP